MLACRSPCETAKSAEATRIDSAKLNECDGRTKRECERATRHSTSRHLSVLPRNRWDSGSTPKAREECVDFHSAAAAAASCCCSSVFELHGVSQNTNSKPLSFERPVFVCCEQARPTLFASLLLLTRCCSGKSVVLVLVDAAAVSVTASHIIRHEKCNM